MESFPRKNKGKMVEYSPRKEKKSRVLQIGEGEIDGAMEAIRRRKR